MRILHCCLSNFYIEGYNYQENILPRQNKSDGHEVLIVASTEIFKDNKLYGYTEPEDYINGDGIRVIRVPYRKTLNNKISRKFRAYKGVYAILEKFKPDVILFHGMSAWELLTVKKYVKKHNTKLLVDNHANYLNSAQGLFSKIVLHKMFYRCILKRTLPYVERVFCIGFRELEFAKKLYGVPEEKLVHYPLGGEIVSDEIYSNRRSKLREELGISDDEIMFLHSGKMDKFKRTEQLVQAFRNVENPKWHLLIAGSFLDDIKENVEKAISQDDRIRYLGWKSGKELMDLLCAADVYMQPGSPSATLQNAMCCGCAVMAQPIQEYRYLLQDYGLYVEDDEDIIKVLKKISLKEINIEQCKKETLEQAQKKLDYKMLAAELYI